MVSRIVDRINRRGRPIEIWRTTRSIFAMSCRCDVRRVSGLTMAPISWSTHPPPQVLCLGGQANALIVGEGQPARSELLAEHAILRLEIIDHLVLLLVDPARQGNNEEP